MKKVILIVLLLAGVINNPLHAARVKVGKVEKIKLVANLPKTDEYLVSPSITTTDNQQLDLVKDYMDLGIKYEVFTIGGMPYWVTKQPEFVGVNAKHKDMYYELAPGEADAILKQINLTREKAMHLSFTDKHAGWLVLIGVILLIILYNKFFGKKNEGDKPAPTITTSSNNATPV